jgi:hypothetical protein
MELTHEPSSEFAIDYSPSFQNKLVDFIEMLNTTQDDDVSVRDLIPINLKPSSRLNSDLYSPSSGATSRTQSRVNSRASSRRASVASSRRSSVSQRALPPPSLSIIQNVKPSSAKLFAAESSFYSHKTPYTSAAVTPAIERTPEIERDSYFDHDEWVQQQLPFKRDFLNTVDYSLEYSIERQKNLSKTSDWDPLKALDKLKQQSESMVLRKSLEHVLKSSMEQQQDGHELETEPLVVQNRVPLFESVWEKTAFDLSSGRSSPRTPVVLQPSSNMSKLLQLEIDKYKQQHESLMLSQPQATVASTLEAELDLSQGNLIHNSVFNQQEQQEQDFSVPIGQQSEPFATFYDWRVMEQSREKLNQLLSGASPSTALDTPLYAKDPKPFVFPTNSYQHNFGFEESPKFMAPSFDMHESDALLDPIIEFAKTKLATLTNPTQEYSKDTKEKEHQASSSNITNLCEDAITAESPNLFPPTLSAALTNLTETQDQTNATFNFVQLVESTPDTQSAVSDTELYQQQLLLNQDFLYTENENKLSDQLNQSLNESASRSLDKGPAIFPQEESKNGHVQLAEMGDLSNSHVEHQSPFSHVESDLMSNENNSLEKAHVHELSTEIRKFIFNPTTTSTIPVDKHDDLEQGPRSLSNDIRVESSCSNHPDNQVGLSTAPNDSKRDSNKRSSKMP